MTILSKKMRNIAIALAVILVLAAGVYFYLGRGKESKPEFAVARHGDIVQEVSVTGQVKPAQSVALAFEKSGKVSGVFGDIGDTVAAGQVIVSLENSEVNAQISQAEAAVESAKAQLLQKNVAYDNGKKNLIDKLQDAYTKADDAVRNKVDQFFSSPRTANPQLNFTTDPGLKNDLETERPAVEMTLNKWQLSLDQLKVSSDLAAYVTEAKQNLDQVKSFLDEVSLAVNGLTTSSSRSQTTIDGWRADVATGRTNVNTATNNITSANQSLETAQTDITLQEAKIKEAKANVDYYRSQLAKTALLSPIDGIVTKQDAKVGEIVSANTTIVSLISLLQLEIDANIPEADIAKVKIGNAAKITLDAYGGDVTFDARVTMIDPAETIIDGVATYKTTFQLVSPDKRIKPGMTANIDISTQQRKNVIIIPQRAVITKDGRKIVRRLDGEAWREVDVATGLRGSDGNVEILEGLKAGDKVLTSFE